MKVVKEIADVRKLIRKARKQEKTVGFVPTMGALHIGHISLLEAAKEKCDFVVVSIFVNPTQFGPTEDFKKYPRPIEADLKICRKHGVDLVFNPEPEQMYGNNNLTWVTVEKLTEPLCSRSRPGHFKGVATVCAKLFNIVQPDIVFFGQKDAQQAGVIKKMVADLNMPLEVVVCPTVRERDGLALSSRNKYLTKSQRKAAPLLYKSLTEARQMIQSGSRKPREIIKKVRDILNQSSLIDVEYINIVDADTLENVKHINGEILIALVAKLGATRLIDNIIIDISKI